MADSYCFADGNPISHIDPFGTDAWVLTDPKGAFGLGFGHTAMVVGNDDMGYFYYSKAMTGFGGGKSKLVNGKPPGNGVSSRFTHYDHFITCPDKDKDINSRRDTTFTLFAALQELRELDVSRLTVWMISDNMNCRLATTCSSTP